ncbi:26S protease regulatory subunit [Perkinsela sp. CCAP 1560/4]|nr:26S protease regulatory subunit [Perkinsela sp. CCAP 1560/4]|eukprot:KNH05442.1 26S protease regulatory subunit [Perkinsela sp. CCAP 1560/4]
MNQLEEAKQRLETKLQELRELEDRVRSLRTQLNGLEGEFTQTEDFVKSLQSVGQICGEVMRKVDEERFMVKSSSGPRYLVGVRTNIDQSQLKVGSRVALDITTLTIMRLLPPEVDPLVFHMKLGAEEASLSFQQIGGLQEQVRQLREVIELPLVHPEQFVRVGVHPPKGVLLYGPPGTGKTLLARAIASNVEATFLRIVASQIVDKYIGESARIVREMFAYARDHSPCIIFIDEIDAIGGRRIEGTSSDREIQRTLMELLTQLDGFDPLSKVKTILATNRPGVLDDALMRPGRIDRKIEIPLPNDRAREDILKIHAESLNISEELDFDALMKLSDGFNGADLRNVCTEAGMFALRDKRDHITNSDFNKAMRKVAESKKLEGNPHVYAQV